MMKRTLNTTVSALALLLALNASGSIASYSDEEGSPKGPYKVGKEEDWDRQSMASRAISDRRGPALKKQELSYNPEDEWETSSQYTSRSQGRGQESQKLTEIKELKKYFFKGNLEITPHNYEALGKYADFYATSFKIYDRGILIKGWKSSLGFELLVDLLHTFEKVKTFKVDITWDKEGIDATEAIARAVQFYEDLTELDIASCKLKETEIIDILDSIVNPEKLKVLNITGNQASASILQRIKKQFPQLASLKSDQAVESLPLASLTLTPQKTRPESTGLSVNTKAPSKLSLPMPPVDPEEQKLPSDVLKKAKAGDPAAQTEIAIFYQKGETVGQNNTKAYEWFAKAANQDYPTAQVYLGWMHLEGKGAQQDDGKALGWFQKAVKAGDRTAQQWIDWMHQNGRDGLRTSILSEPQTQAPLKSIPAQPTFTLLPEEKGLPLEVLRSAKAGNAKAQYDIGEKYYKGEGVAQNYAKAMDTYHKAAHQNHVPSQMRLRDIYEAKQGIFNNPIAAFQDYQERTRTGDRMAEIILGWMYRDGFGTEKDDKKAIAIFQKNADQGYAAAQANLGKMYYNGQGVAKDDATAVAWWRKAAAQGYAAAQNSLGWMYANGRGVAKDDVTAVAWYRKAADQGSADAQCNLGEMYDNGRGVAKDDAMAVQWYRKAEQWYRKAADQGSADAQFSLGIMYAEGQGVAKDDAMAVQWYRKAADQGDAAAQNNLGVMYDNGRGVAKDDATAVAWYRKAADQGEAIAQNNLGWMYENGRGVAKDDAMAVQWYRKAADKGCAAAQNNLGIMYRDGRGVAKDDATAVSWYRKAADQGDADAQFNLGWMYENNRGVPKKLFEFTSNKEKAIEWYKKAAAQGQENAKKALQRLGVKS